MWKGQWQVCAHSIGKSDQCHQSFCFKSRARKQWNQMCSFVGTILWKRDIFRKGTACWKRAKMWRNFFCPLRVLVRKINPSVTTTSRIIRMTRWLNPIKSPFWRGGGGVRLRWQRLPQGDSFPPLYFQPRGLKTRSFQKQEEHWERTHPAGASTTLTFICSTPNWSILSDSTS